MGRNLLLIINPNSGDGIGKRWITDMIEKLSPRYGIISVFMSRGVGDIMKTVRENAAGYEAIVCCGGDGTMNEAINGVIRSGANPALGYIPTGTVNDFANSHGIPRTIKPAIELIADATDRDYDIGVLGDRCFSYVAAFGAFTEVSYLTSQTAKASFGKAAYIAEAALKLSALKPISLRCEAEGVSFEGEYIYAMATNSVTVGGIKFFTSSERSFLRDGLIEITLVKFPKNIYETQEALRGLLIPGEKNAVVQRASVKEAEFIFADKTAWTVDGEYGGTFDRVTVKDLYRRVRILEK